MHITYKIAFASFEKLNVPLKKEIFMLLCIEQLLFWNFLNLFSACNINLASSFSLNFLPSTSQYALYALETYLSISNFVETQIHVVIRNPRMFYQGNQRFTLYKLFFTFVSSPFPLSPKYYYPSYPEIGKSACINKINSVLSAPSLLNKSRIILITLQHLEM